MPKESEMVYVLKGDTLKRMLVDVFKSGYQHGDEGGMPADLQVYALRQARQAMAVMRATMRFEKVKVSDA